MTLSIKIKKIISVVLLLCVVVGAVPMQMFAQTAPDIGLFSGWDKSRIAVRDTYQSADDLLYNRGAASSLSTPKTGNGGRTFELDGAEIGALKEKIRQSGRTNSPIDSVFASQGHFYGVSTNDGRVSYYYKGENKGSSPQDAADDIFIGHATKGELYIPLQNIIKSTGATNPNSTDINTEQGFVNAVDIQNGKPANSSYSALANVDQLDNLKQEQVSNDARLEELKKQLAADDEARNQDASEVLSLEERTDLENEIAQRTTRSNIIKNSISQGTRASESNKLELGDKCDVNIIKETQFFTSNGCVVTLLAILANIALKMSALVLYWTGNLFDYSIEIAVNSAQFLKELNIVEPTWALVRDALNMTFIFILLFVAVQILLGKSGYTAKGSIARLVLVAILMNFSLFAAKVMVDASNIISLNVYESIKTTSGSGESRGNVSARIMTTLGLSSVYSFGSAFDNTTVPGCGGVPGTILTVGIFGTILLIITSLAFLLVAILFFLRMLNIMVLFITSPIWIWGYVMENKYFESKTAWWMGSMWHVLKFPVMFMVMLYVALAMFAQLNIAQVSKGEGRMSFIQLICSTAGNPNSSILDNLPLILNFILVIMSIGGIIAYSAKNAGTGGLLGTNKLATNIGNKFNDYQKKFTTGAAQGVYNKSTGAVLAVGNGAIALGGKVKDATLTIAKDGARTIGNNIGNKVSDKLGGIATNSFASMPKVQTAFAMMSDKFKDPKIFGETEKKAEERRTKGAKERIKILKEIQLEQSKVDSMKDWKKKNPEGTAAEYKKYLENKVAQRTKIFAGGLEDMNAGKDEEGNDITTEDLIRTRVIMDDGKGGYKLDEQKLYKNIQDARKFHAENGDLLKVKKSQRWGIMKGERTKARIKAEDDAINKALSEVRKKESGKEKRIKDLRDSLEKLPLDFENLKAVDKKKYNGIVVSFIHERDSILKERDRKIGDATSDDEERKIKEVADDEIDTLKISTKDKIVDERNKIENSISKLERELETEKEKKEAKEDKAKEKK